MDVIGVPTEAQIKRMQGIIAMLQGDKKTLVQRTDHLEEQNTLLQTTINKLAKQAEDATNKLELLTTENNNLVNELQTVRNKYSTLQKHQDYDIQKLQDKNNELNTRYEQLVQEYTAVQNKALLQNEKYSKLYEASQASVEMLSKVINERDSVTLEKNEMQIQYDTYRDTTGKEIQKLKKDNQAAGTMLSQLIAELERVREINGKTIQWHGQKVALTLLFNGLRTNKRSVLQEAFTLWKNSTLQTVLRDAGIDSNDHNNNARKSILSSMSSYGIRSDKTGNDDTNENSLELPIMEGTEDTAIISSTNVTFHSLARHLRQLQDENFNLDFKLETYANEHSTLQQQLSIALQDKVTLQTNALNLSNSLTIVENELLTERNRANIAQKQLRKIRTMLTNTTMDARKTIENKLNSLNMLTSGGPSTTIGKITNSNNNHQQRRTSTAADNGATKQMFNIASSSSSSSPASVSSSVLSSTHTSPAVPNISSHSRHVGVVHNRYPVELNNGNSSTMNDNSVTTSKNNSNINAPGRAYEPQLLDPDNDNHDTLIMNRKRQVIHHRVDNISRKVEEQHYRSAAVSSSAYPPSKGYAYGTTKIVQRNPKFSSLDDENSTTASYEPSVQNYPDTLSVDRGSANDDFDDYSSSTSDAQFHHPVRGDDEHDHPSSSIDPMGIENNYSLNDDYGSTATTTNDLAEPSDPWFESVRLLARVHAEQQRCTLLLRELEIKHRDILVLNQDVQHYKDNLDTSKGIEHKLAKELSNEEQKRLQLQAVIKRLRLLYPKDVDGALSMVVASVKNTGSNQSSSSSSFSNESIVNGKDLLYEFAHTGQLSSGLNNVLSSSSYSSSSTTTTTGFATPLPSVSFASTMHTPSLHALASVTLDDTTTTMMNTSTIQNTNSNLNSSVYFNPAANSSYSVAASLLRTITLLQQRLDNTEDELKHAEERENRVREEKNRLMNDLEKQKSIVIGLSNQVQTARDALVSEQTTASLATAELSGKSATLSALQEKLSIMIATIENKSREISNLQTTVTALQSSNQRIENELSITRTNLHKQSSGRELAEAQLQVIRLSHTSERGRATDNLWNAIHEARDEKQAILQTLHEAQKRCEILSSEKEEMKVTYQHNAHEIQQLSETLQASVDELTKLRQQLQLTETDLRKANTDIDTYKASLEAAHVRLRETEERLYHDMQTLKTESTRIEQQLKEENSVTAANGKAETEVIVHSLETKYQDKFRQQEEEQKERLQALQNDYEKRMKEMDEGAKESMEHAVEEIRSSLMNELMRVRISLEKTEQIKDSLVQDTEEKETIIENLQLEKERLTNEVSLLQTNQETGKIGLFDKVQETEKELLRLTKEYETITIELSNLRTELMDEKSMRKVHEEESQSLRQELTNVNTQLERARGIITSLESLASKQNEAISFIKDRLEKKEKELDDVRKTGASMDATKDKESISTTASAIPSTVSKEASIELTKLIGELTAVKAAAARDNTLVNSLKDSIVALKADLEGAKAIVSRHTASLAEATERITILTTALERAQSDNVHLLGSLSSLGVEHASIVRRIESFTALLAPKLLDSVTEIQINHAMKYGTSPSSSPNSTNKKNSPTSSDQDQQQQQVLLKNMTVQVPFDAVETHELVRLLATSLPPLQLHTNSLSNNTNDSVGNIMFELRRTLQRICVATARSAGLYLPTTVRLNRNDDNNHNYSEDEEGKNMDDDENSITQYANETLQGMAELQLALQTANDTANTKMEQYTVAAQRANGLAQELEMVYAECLRLTEEAVAKGEEVNDLHGRLRGLEETVAERDAHIAALVETHRLLVEGPIPGNSTTMESTAKTTKSTGASDASETVAISIPLKEEEQKSSSSKENRSTETAIYTRSASIQEFLRSLTAPESPSSETTNSTLSSPGNHDESSFSSSSSAHYRTPGLPSPTLPTIDENNNGNDDDSNSVHSARTPISLSTISPLSGDIHSDSHVSTMSRSITVQSPVNSSVSPPLSTSPPTPPNGDTSHHPSVMHPSPPVPSRFINSYSNTSFPSPSSSLSLSSPSSTMHHDTDSLDRIKAAAEAAISRSRAGTENRYKQQQFQSPSNTLSPSSSTTNNPNHGGSSTENVVPIITINKALETLESDNLYYTGTTADIYTTTTESVPSTELYPATPIGAREARQKRALLAAESPNASFDTNTSTNNNRSEVSDSINGKDDRNGNTDIVTTLFPSSTATTSVSMSSSTTAKTTETPHLSSNTTIPSEDPEQVVPIPSTPIPSFRNHLPVPVPEPIAPPVPTVTTTKPLLQLTGVWAQLYPHAAAPVVEKSHTNDTSVTPTSRNNGNGNVSKSIGNSGSKPPLAPLPSPYSHNGSNSNNTVSTLPTTTTSEGILLSPGVSPGSRNNSHRRVHFAEDISQTKEISNTTSSPNAPMHVIGTITFPQRAPPPPPPGVPVPEISPTNVMNTTNINNTTNNNSSLSPSSVSTSSNVDLSLLPLDTLLRMALASGLGSTDKNGSSSTTTVTSTSTMSPTTNSTSSSSSSNLMDDTKTTLIHGVPSLSLPPVPRSPSDSHKEAIDAILAALAETDEE